MTFHLIFTDGTERDIEAVCVDRINGTIDYLENGVVKRLDESNPRLAHYYRTDDVQARFTAEWLKEKGYMPKGETH